MKKLLVCVLAVMFVLSASTAMAAKAETFHEMFTKGKASGWLKANHWAREYDDARADQVTTNFGLKLALSSANYNGFTFKTSFYANEDFGINDPDDDETQYVLLAARDGNQFDPYQTFGEYYIRYSYSNTMVTLGSQELVTGGFSFWPARMIPITYENFNIVNKSIKGLKLYGGYVWSYRDVNTDERADIAAFARGTNDDGWWWAEADYRGIKNARLHIGYIHYTNLFYTLNLHATYKGMFNKDWGYNLWGLYQPAGDVGDGADYDSYEAGIRAGITYKGHAFGFKWSQQGDDGRKQPRGAFITIAMVSETCGEPSESAWQLAYDYKFGGWAKGLSFQAQYGVFDRDAANDRDELYMQLRYRPKAGLLKYNDFRVRYSIMQEDENDDGDVKNLRLYYTYSF